jgi:hypothetical protein
LHGLVTLFLEVIALAITLLLVGLFAFVVLVFATRVIMALIFSMLTVMLSFFAMMSVASMVVTIFATMLPVAQILAASNSKISRILLFQLFFLLDLVKDVGRFISSLTWLKEGHEPKRVCGHHLDCFHKLVLMRLALH